MMAKKQEKKRKKKIGIGLRVIRFVFFIILLLALLGVLAYFTCNIKTVTVEGTTLYSDAEIKEMVLDDQYSFNAVYVFLKNAIMPKTDIEFIDKCDVRMTSYDAVSIVAHEKSIMGYMTNDNVTYIYFDYDGNIVEVSQRFIDGYTKVEGVLCEDPQVGQTLAIGEREISYLTSLIKLVIKYELVPNLIHYDVDGTITLMYDNYNIDLGNSNYLEDKISRVQYILPNLEGMTGTLHLENFSNENTDIVFEKAE